MTICPMCGHENIEGVDACDQCGESLMDQELHLPPPATEVERALLHDRVTVLEPKVPITVRPNQPIRDVLKLLVDESIGCVLVADEKKLLGIFSERDALLKLNCQSTELGDRPVSEFMTAKPQTLDDTAKVAFAVQRMDLGSFRHVPVISSDGRPTGIVSARDILRYLTEKMSSDPSDS